MGFFKDIIGGATKFLGSSTGIGTMISAGTDLLGNILSNNSQLKANEANIRVAQMNNEFNERMLEKQMRYNSAPEQVQRFKDAGLNPALMMQGQGAGQAGVATAAAFPEIRPQNWDFSSIGNAIQAGVQRHKENQMLDEEIQGIRIENQYKRQKIIQELANMKQEELSRKVKNRIDEQIYSNLGRQQTAEYETELARKDDLRSQIQKRTAEILLLDKEIANFDARWDLQKSMAVAEILLKGAQTKRSKQEMRTEVYNTLKAQYDASYAKQNAKNLARMSDAIVNKAWNDSYYSQFPTNQYQMIGGFSKLVTDGVKNKTKQFLDYVAGRK